MWHRLVHAHVLPFYWSSPTPQPSSPLATHTRLHPDAPLTHTSLLLRPAFRFSPSEWGLHLCPPQRPPAPTSAPTSWWCMERCATSLRLLFKWMCRCGPVDRPAGGDKESRVLGSSTTCSQWVNTSSAGTLGCAEELLNCHCWNKGNRYGRWCRGASVPHPLLAFYRRTNGPWGYETGVGGGAFYSLIRSKGHHSRSTVPAACCLLCPNLKVHQELGNHSALP